MNKFGPLEWRAINTVYQAIQFLRKELSMQVIGTVFGWHLSDGEFDATLANNEELIEHARRERDILLELRGEVRR